MWAFGSVEASVLGSGNGLVKSSATLLYHGEGSNLGSDTQSLKPFVINGSGTINSSIQIDFDAVMLKSYFEYYTLHCSNGGGPDIPEDITEDGYEALRNA